ncbi:hypothetical protein [Alteromonas phage JH01]|nr:hypothetical protein [Alteromonas phage JH01]
MAEIKKDTTPKGVEVTLLKACTHAGEDIKEGGKVTVTEAQKKVMQKHGLVEGESK